MHLEEKRLYCASGGPVAANSMDDREVASRGRVSWEQVEVTAQSATVLRHLLASVELRARGIAFTFLDKGIHLERQSQWSRV